MDGGPCGCACSVVQRSSSSRRYAAQAAFERQSPHHRTEIPDLRAQGIVYRPLVWTADGRPRPAVTRTMQDVADIASCRNGQQMSAKAIQHRWKHVILNCFPTTRSSDDTGSLAKQESSGFWPDPWTGLLTTGLERFCWMEEKMKMPMLEPPRLCLKIPLPSIPRTCDLCTRACSRGGIPLGEPPHAGAQRHFFHCCLLAQYGVEHHSPQHGDCEEPSIHALAHASLCCQVPPASCRCRSSTWRKAGPTQGVRKSLLADLQALAATCTSNCTLLLGKSTFYTLPELLDAFAAPLGDRAARLLRAPGRTSHSPRSFLA